MRYPPLIAALILLAGQEIHSAESIRDSVGEMPITDRTARVEVARLLGKDARIQEAVEEYRRLLKEDASFYQARLELARLLALQEKTHEARSLLEAIPFSSLDRDGKETLASIEETSGAFDKAQTIYEELIKETPADQPIRFRLAQVLSWQKKYEPAIRQYETLLRERPQDVQLIRSYAQVLGWAGRNQEALKLWQQSLALPQ